MALPDCRLYVKLQLFRGLEHVKLFNRVSMVGKNFLPFPTLKTERLTLRQLVSSDDIELFALRSNENVNKYLGRKPVKSIADASVFIHNISMRIRSNESIYWAIGLSGIEKLIGTVCFYNFSADNLKVKIGYELSPNFQRKGLMQEAASKVIDFAIETIGLKSIQACTHFENQGSINLLRKLNFVKLDACDNTLITFQLSSNR